MPLSSGNFIKTMSPKETEQMINDYRNLYHKKFGVWLTREAALDLAYSLIAFWRVVARPIPKEGKNEVNNSSKT